MTLFLKYSTQSRQESKLSEKSVGPILSKSLSDLLEADGVVKDGEFAVGVPKVGLGLVQPLQPERLCKKYFPTSPIIRFCDGTLADWEKEVIFTWHTYTNIVIGLDWIIQFGLPLWSSQDFWDLFVKGELVELHGAVHVKVDPGRISG